MRINLLTVKIDKYLFCKPFDSFQGNIADFTRFMDAEKLFFV